MKTLKITLALALLPTVAYAEPRFEVLDRGDAVEIIAHDVKTSRTTINVARQRIEIPLATMVTAKRATPTDATVQLAEIDPDAKAVSIKLTLDHNGVVGLAKYAQAMQIGDDLHVIMPRKIPADGATVTLPEPTLPTIVPPLPSFVPPIVPPGATAKTPEVAKPDAKSAETKPETVKTDDKGSAAAAGLGTKPDPTTTPPAKLGTADDTSSNTSTFIGAGLLAAAAGIWLWKRKKGAAANLPASSIEILAQKSLGGRARVIWLAAGSRELMVAVTPQQVRLLGEWPRAENKPAFARSGPIRMPTATAQPAVAAPQPPPAPVAVHTSSSFRDELAAADSPPPARARTTTSSTTAQGSSNSLSAVSPALSGLLRLRERSLPAVTEDVATGDPDADATWARELLAATAGRR